MDSKAAKAITSRLGVGAVRHLAVKVLWIQHLVKQKVLKVVKVPGDINHADIGTKVLSRPVYYELLRMMSIRRVRDANSAPEPKAVGAVSSADSPASLLSVPAALAHHLQSK